MPKICALPVSPAQIVNVHVLTSFRVFLMSVSVCIAHIHSILSEKHARGAVFGLFSKRTGNHLCLVVVCKVPDYF